MATEIPLRRLQVVGALLVLIGLALLVGGVMLVVAGGSVAYLLAGIGFAASGVLLWRRSTTALLVYAVLLAALLAWSLSEVGLDWWPLAARLDVAFVFGLLLVLPWFARPLAGPRSHWGVLGAAVAVSAVVAIVAGTRNPHDVDGELPQTATAALTAASEVPDGEWHAYGRTAAGQRFSPLAQITPANAGDLQVAWQFRTGDVRGRPGDPEETTDEVTPLKIGSRLYLCTPHQSVIALDATTGAQAWRYDPKMATGLALQHETCRGLSYEPPQGAAAVAPVAAASIATSGRALDIAANDGKARADCDAKLFLATADGRVIALDPDTGAVCSRFGGGAGQIDLGAGMPNLNPGSYYSTSPVVVTKKLLIVGGTVLDNVSTKEESGVIRAFDIDTGALVWNWDSGNPDVTTPLAAGAHYTANSPNSWSIASVDEMLGMVYLPMGNQPPDQWGGHRSAAVEKYSSSVTALDLATGQVRWVFQTVHHDLWDYDVPSQPSLVDLTIGGATVPALVQPTKQGELFVLDRRTGKPVLPVTEVPAPEGAATGDHSAPTQPKSALSYEPPRLDAKDMWGGTILDQMVCRIQFAKLRYEGRFTPPSTQGSLIYPGNFGTFNWGGVAVDPQRGVAFTTPTYLAFVSTLVPRANATTEYVQNGHPPEGALPALNENFGAPFAIKLGPFTSPLGIPCQAPPWGYVAGADLHTGQIAWKHRNGTVRDLSPLPVPFRMGVPNLGGPVMTAGGVAFLSGSMDDYVRGYDVRDGHQVWESRLPAGGQATPMTYTGADGRQFLLVIAGGHGSTHTKPGDYVIAYALPKR
jgi:quinoprotein glucose dehydrogenase